MHCPSSMTEGRDANVTERQENDVRKSLQEDGANFLETN